VPRLSASLHFWLGAVMSVPMACRRVGGAASLCFWLAVVMSVVWLHCCIAAGVRFWLVVMSVAWLHFTISAVVSCPSAFGLHPSAFRFWCVYSVGVGNGTVEERLRAKIPATFTNLELRAA
jgi:hypothetical protein